VLERLADDTTNVIGDDVDEMRVIGRLTRLKMELEKEVPKAAGEDAV
jgi:hypothetical protein